jgi:hypothetical protein
MCVIWFRVHAEAQAYRSTWRGSCQQVLMHFQVLLPGAKRFLCQYLHNQPSAVGTTIVVGGVYLAAA